MCLSEVFAVGFSCQCLSVLYFFSLLKEGLKAHDSIFFLDSSVMSGITIESAHAMLTTYSQNMCS